MKRFRDTSKVDKEWYMTLSPSLKCAVDFVQDKCDNSGVWEINMVLLNTCVNPTKNITLDDLLKIDNGNQFVKISAKKIYCIGFIIFQYGALSEKCIPHKKIIELINKHNLDYLALDRVHSTLKEKEKEEEVEEEKEKEEPEKILHRYAQAIKDTCLNITKIKRQLSNEEAEKLEQEFGDELVKEVIDSMENYKDIGKYQSVYLTARKWCNKEKKNNNIIKFNHGSTHQRGGKPLGTASSAIIEEGRDFGSL